MKTTTLVSKFQQVETEGKKYVIERDNIFHILNVALLTELNVLLLSLPGTAKTYLVKLWSSLVSNRDSFFYILLNKFSTVEELIGPVSLKGLENDRYIRILKGRLAEAEIGMIDECFKANSGILNSLLSASNERKISDGEKEISIPLKVLVGASNEVPDKDDNLDAFYDRFILKSYIEDIKDSSNKKKLIFIPEVPEYVERIINEEDIKKARAEYKSVQFTDKAVDTYLEIKKAVEKIGVRISDRTFKVGARILKAEAYLSGNEMVTLENFSILENALWSDPNDRKKVSAEILKIVNPEKNSLMVFSDEADEIYNDVFKKEGIEEQVKQGFEALGKLGNLRDKVGAYRTKYKNDTDAKSIEEKMEQYVEVLYKLCLGKGVNEIKVRK